MVMGALQIYTDVDVDVDDVKSAFWNTRTPEN